jgi:hypothetical protein
MCCDKVAAPLGNFWIFFFFPRLFLGVRKCIWSGLEVSQLGNSTKSETRLVKFETGQKKLAGTPNVTA